MHPNPEPRRPDANWLSKLKALGPDDQPTSARAQRTGQAPPESSLRRVPPSDNPAYVEATVRAVLDDLGKTTTDCNTALNDAMLRAARLMPYDLPNRDWLRNKGIEKSYANGYIQRDGLADAHRTIDSAFAGADRLGVATDVPEPSQRIEPKVGPFAPGEEPKWSDDGHDDVERDDEFLESRPTLARIRDYATCRRVSPLAVFGVVAAEAIARIPPQVVLPPLVGGRASLNSFIALVGASGAGKDSAEAAAHEGFPFGGRPVLTVPLGSGEGIARTFRPQGVKPDEDNPVASVIFSASEIDTWTALDGRTGSTLTAEMRKVYSGSTIGFANAGRDTRNVVPAHSYRACLIAGVQPLRSGPLLSAADGGLPQRFVWLPTLDPHAPAEVPDAPDPFPIGTPDWNTPDGASFVGGYIEIGVPAAARAEIDAHRLAVLRGNASANPLDGHALLTRLKVAAALMALELRTEITEDDWHLAGRVMAVSRRTREACQRVLADQASQQTHARAMNSADREEIVSERRSQRARDGILRQLRRQPTPQRRTELRRRLKGDIRDYFDAALAELLTAGDVVESAEGPMGHGVHVALAGREDDL